MDYSKLIPSDSSLHMYMKILEYTEVPKSYQVATGLSLIGCVCRRKVYIDQVNWKVYPTLRLLLVGPSGIGKDTTIDRVEETLNAAAPGIPIKGGKTFEFLAAELAEIPPPCVAFIPAYELTSFIGKSNYQESMVQRLTDLLSDKSKMNISSRKDGELYIYEPTITIQAGSTIEWLQKAMPDGSLEGGFFPRFLIVVEEYNSKNIALVAHEISKSERIELESTKEKWYDWVRKLNNKILYNKSKEMIILEDAVTAYTNWYWNRHKYFDLSVRPYAERSRDQVLRLAMLMAVSRNRPWVDIKDMTFAIEFMNFLGGKIASAVVAPSTEGRVVAEIKKLINQQGFITFVEVLRALAPKFGGRKVKEAIDFLQTSEQISIKEKTIRLKDED